MTLLTQNLKSHRKSCSITFTNLCKCFRFQNNQLCICRYMYKTHDYSRSIERKKKKEKKENESFNCIKPVFTSNIRTIIFPKKGF